MQLTTLLLSLSLAITAFAAPLLTKRQGVYTIDGEPNTEFRLDHDKHGRPIVPEDFPSYDSLPHLQCEAHINYVPRISRKTWQMECPPSTFFLFLFLFYFPSTQVRERPRTCKHTCLGSKT
jgi:hypothetical protein